MGAAAGKQFRPTTGHEVANQLRTKHANIVMEAFKKYINENPTEASTIGNHYDHDNFESVLKTACDVCNVRQSLSELNEKDIEDIATLYFTNLPVRPVSVIHRPKTVQPQLELLVEDLVDSDIFETRDNYNESMIKSKNDASILLEFQSERKHSSINQHKLYLAEYGDNDTGVGDDKQSSTLPNNDSTSNLSVQLPLMSSFTVANAKSPILKTIAANRPVTSPVSSEYKTSSSSSSINQLNVSKPLNLFNVNIDIEELLLEQREDQLKSRESESKNDVVDSTTNNNGLVNSLTILSPKSELSSRDSAIRYRSSTANKNSRPASKDLVGSLIPHSQAMLPSRDKSRGSIGGSKERFFHANTPLIVTDFNVNVGSFDDAFDRVDMAAIPNTFGSPSERWRKNQNQPLVNK